MLDRAGGALIDAILEQQSRSGAATIRLDLTGVVTADLDGVHALVAARRWCHFRGVRLLLTGANATLREVFGSTVVGRLLLAHMEVDLPELGSGKTGDPLASAPDRVPAAEHLERAISALGHRRGMTRGSAFRVLLDAAHATNMPISHVAARVAGGGEV